MTTARPRPLPSPTAVALRRWLCAWLALWIALQGTSSALAALHGVWHHHRPTIASAPMPSSVAWRWQHGSSAAAVVDSAHARWHDEGVVHRHAVTDDSVWSATDEAAGDAVGQLASVLAAGTDTQWLPDVDARHVRSNAGAWSATSRSIPPPLRPPRG
jgi:hypothetical protein